MWGKLKLPMFLFNMGLLTLMNMDSLIFLAKLGREGYSLARNIKESIFIRVNNPTLNRNTGKFNLPLIWDGILLNTPGLNLKRHVHAIGHVNCSNSNNPYNIII